MCVPKVWDPIMQLLHKSPIETLVNLVVRFAHGQCIRNLVCHALNVKRIPLQSVRQIPTSPYVQMYLHVHISIYLSIYLSNYISIYIYTFVYV